MAERIPIQFLKLGGSLITEKAKPHTPRPDIIKRLAEEIAAVWQRQPGLRLLLGHGSGSFGHVPASKYGTIQGVRTPEQWQGFADVWKEAAALDRLVIDALHAADLPAVALPASAAVTTDNGRITHWDLTPLTSALGAGLLPVVYGDVIFDLARGGTILSTEDLFAYLAQELVPSRLLLAGIEPGVWADFPACTRLVDEITLRNYGEIAPALGEATTTDVTGGMAAKVRQAMLLAQKVKGLEILIFSGMAPGTLREVLSGGKSGTCIR